MKRIMLIAGLLICFATPLFAQESAEEPVEKPVKLPDAVMEQVVKRIVRRYFMPTKRRKTVYFSSQNIKRDWLPKIKNITFLFPSLPQERDVWFFDDVSQDGKNFVIQFGSGNPECGASGDLWTFRVVKSRVRLHGITGGWNSDCWPSVGASQRFFHRQGPENTKE